MRLATHRDRAHVDRLGRLRAVVPVRGHAARAGALRLGRAGLGGLLSIAASKFSGGSRRVRFGRQSEHLAQEFDTFHAFAGIAVRRHPPHPSRRQLFLLSLPLRRRPCCCPSAVPRNVDRQSVRAQVSCVGAPLEPSKEIACFPARSTPPTTYLRIAWRRRWLIVDPAGGDRLDHGGGLDVPAQPLSRVDLDHHRSAARAGEFRASRR